MRDSTLAPPRGMGSTYRVFSSGRCVPSLRLQLSAVGLRATKLLGKGYGRRRWLTGRVFGECGRTYALATRQGCRCRGDSRLIPTKCGDVRVGLKRLEATVFRALHEVLCDPERLRGALIQARADWELKVYQVEEQRDSIRRQLEELGTRRRLLSIQHEHRVINDAELLIRFRSLEEEERRAQDALQDLTTPAAAQMDSSPSLTARSTVRVARRSGRAGWIPAPC